MAETDSFFFRRMKFNIFSTLFSGEKDVEEGRGRFLNTWRTYPSSQDKYKKRKRHILFPILIIAILHNQVDKKTKFFCFFVFWNGDIWLRLTADVKGVLRATFFSLSQKKKSSTKWVTKWRSHLFQETSFLQLGRGRRLRLRRDLELCYFRR